jgi:hypothetical protein
MDIFKKIAEVFSKWTDNSTDVDKYITSKHPQTPGDVDYWLARYYKERSTKFYVY